jgi:cyclopropane-fatty-acyl-phospholipid synthase
MTLHAGQFKEQHSRGVLGFLQEIFSGYHPRDFEVELWDGTRWLPDAGQFRRFTWQIKHPSALKSALASASELTLGESYICGDFDLLGDIHAVFPVADYLLSKDWSLKEKLHILKDLFALPSSAGNEVQSRPALDGDLHSIQRDRKAIKYHYDVSNDFYSLFLDKNMVYSCAYFEHAEDNLETAQINKLEYICRKLRLNAGERLLDLGCGWGGLLMHAAAKYGVHATGVTLSDEQLALARQRIREAGLSTQCEVKLLDYRELTEVEAYDKLVSVGMVEHVGESKLYEYFRQAFSLLRPGGIFLNHGIGTRGQRPVSKQPSFTDVYVFPDGELVPIHTTLEAAERAGFEVRDVENLREHYDLTLRHWLNKLESRAEEAIRFANEKRYRIWRLYLAGSAHYFRTGRLNLYQTLLAKTSRSTSRLPLTRNDWYRPENNVGS